MTRYPTKAEYLGSRIWSLIHPKKNLPKMLATPMVQGMSRGNPVYTGINGIGT
jgi:hypothetical protein